MDHRSCPRSPPPARADRPATSSRSPETPSRSRRARNPAAMRAARASPSRSRKCVAAETEGITCHGLRIRTAISPLFLLVLFLGPFRLERPTRAVTRAGRGRARAVYRASRESIHPGRAPKDRGGAIMPLVRSNDAPDSADPVRCAILQTDARPLPFFPPNRVSSDGSRPRGRSMDAVGALDPDPAADTASRLPLAPILAVSTALTRPFHPVSLAGPAPYSVWCRPPAHPVRMRQRTQGAPAEGSEGALTALGAPTAAIRARRSSTPTTSASTRGSLPPLPTLRDERDARQIKFHQPARFERSPPQRSASSSHRTAFSPPRTGTWVTAGSSARAEAPSSA